MNEVDFLRDQVALERQHFDSVRGACAAAIGSALDPARLDELCRVAARYLCFAGERSALQDRAHCELLRARVARDDAASHKLVDDLGATLAPRRATLETLAAALADRRTDTLGAAEFVAICRETLRALDDALARRPPVLQRLFDRHYRVAEWRAASHIDADSILEERERYERVRAKLPRGIDLEPAMTG